MDEIDKYIKKIVTKKIEEPPSFEKAIREALYSEKFYKRMRKRKIIKTISTACATIVLTSGVAVGGFITYEKVWKEPKQYTYEELKNTIAQSEVPEEEKANLISEDDAKNKALEIVNNLGYENQEITKIELNQNKEEYIEKTYYKIETQNNENQNLNIRLNAETGELESLEDNNLLANKSNTDEISKDKAIEIANSIYEDIGVDINEYELNYCDQNNISYRGNGKEIWEVKSNKKYDGIVNPYEELIIDFIINSGEIGIWSINHSQNGKYENNPEVITEEEAIRIATNKEKEFTNNEISETTVKKGIRKANSFIYKMENNYQNININNENNTSEIIKNEIEIRKVWLVNITHNEETEIEDAFERLKTKNKIYYIDVTTGEIIGGQYSEKS